ncbi:MAG: hypothetical protein WC314_06490 [Vulcanimicrobiota bacterium]
MKTDTVVYAAIGGAAVAAATFTVAAGALRLTPDTSLFWYLSRSSGLVAYALLWLSTLAGLLMSGRARLLPGRTAMELHKMASGTALAFALFHGLVLSGDRYMNWSLSDLLVPLTTSYQPFWLAAGQLSLTFSVALLASSALRQSLGNKAWRVLHYIAFLAYWLALGHALVMGSDTGHPLVSGFYLLSGGSILWLTTARIWIREGGKHV